MILINKFEIYCFLYHIFLKIDQIITVILRKIQNFHLNFHVKKLYNMIYKIFFKICKIYIIYRFDIQLIFIKSFI